MRRRRTGLGPADVQDAGFEIDLIYRAQAEFWAHMAEVIKRLDYQDRWLRLAEQWRELSKKTNGENHGLHCRISALGVTRDARARPSSGFDMAWRTAQRLRRCPDRRARA